MFVIHSKHLFHENMYFRGTCEKLTALKEEYAKTKERAEMVKELESIRGDPVKKDSYFFFNLANTVECLLLNGHSLPKPIKEEDIPRIYRNLDKEAKDFVGHPEVAKLRFECFFLLFFLTCVLSIGLVYGIRTKRYTKSSLFFSFFTLKKKQKKTNKKSLPFTVVMITRSFLCFLS